MNQRLKAGRASVTVTSESEARIITTVAGIGAIGAQGSDSGDGGPANSASLYRPSGAPVDGAGNLLIASRHNATSRPADGQEVKSTSDASISTAKLACGSGDPLLAWTPAPQADGQ